jgi:hypothetical protein
MAWSVEELLVWEAVKLVLWLLILVSPSCDISWFIENQQDWKMVVLAGL